MNSFSDPFNTAKVVEPPIPRMVGDTDIEIVKFMADRLAPAATIVELGPWLGGVTEVLSGYGTVHVVDRFIWSEYNAKRMPGLFSPGDDFQSEFDRIMAENELAPIVHRSAFRDFVWDGEEIDFCFIDAPRSARDLHDCLRSISGGLRRDAPVLIKRGANSADFGMAALIHLLLARGDFVLADIDQPSWCNIAVLKAGPDLSGLAAEVWSPDLLKTTPSKWSVRDPWGGELFAAARVAAMVSQADWRSAFSLLESMPPMRRVLRNWDELEALLKIPDSERAMSNTFSSIFGSHHGGAVPEVGSMDLSESAALRGAWAHWADAPSKVAAFRTLALRIAYQTGGFGVSARLADDIEGKHVLVVGRGLRPAGVAAIASGVASFVGLETATGEGPGAVLDLFGAADIGQIEKFEAHTDGPFDVFAVVENFAMNEHLLGLIEKIEAKLPATCAIIRLNDTQEPLA